MGLWCESLCPVRFHLCPTNPTLTVSFSLRSRWVMWISRSDGLRCDFSANKLTIWMSYMSFCNFNSILDWFWYAFFHLVTAPPFPLQNLMQRLRFQNCASVSAIPCEFFGNTLKALLFYEANTCRIYFMGLVSLLYYLKIRNFNGTHRADYWRSLENVYESYRLNRVWTMSTDYFNIVFPYYV